MFIKFITTLLLFSSAQLSFSAEENENFFVGECECKKRFRSYSVRWIVSNLDNGNRKNVGSISRKSYSGHRDLEFCLEELNKQSICRYRQSGKHAFGYACMASGGGSYRAVGYSINQKLGKMEVKEFLGSYGGHRAFETCLERL